MTGDYCENNTIEGIMKEHMRHVDASVSVSVLSTYNMAPWADTPLSHMRQSFIIDTIGFREVLREIRFDTREGDLPTGIEGINTYDMRFLEETAKKEGLFLDEIFQDGVSGYLGDIYEIDDETLTTEMYVYSY